MQTIEINTATCPSVRRIKDILRSKSANPRTIIIDDVENIQQAIAAGVAITELYCIETLQHSPEIIALQQLTTLPLHLLTATVLKAVFGEDKAVKVFALAQTPKPHRLKQLQQTQKDLVVLDGVRIVGNIGAVIRSACAFNSAAVALLDSGLAHVYDRRLIRASRGLVFQIPVLLASRAEFAQFISDTQMPVATLAIDGADPLPEIARASGNLALVFGSERTGASEQINALSSKRYVIAMQPMVESLNVSVTAGITLFQRSLGAQQKDVSRET